MPPDDGFGPTWDERRGSAPARPAFSTSLPEHTPLPRPRAVVVALWLVVAATLAFVAFTALAALRIDELRSGLADELPASVTDDYSDRQVARAVWVLVGVVGGVGVVLALVALLAMRATAVDRRHASRTTFVTMVVLYLPVAVLAPAIRQGGLVDDVLAITNLVLLLAAVVLVTRPQVSAWLRQTERTGRAPLVPPAPGDETTPAAAGRRPVGRRPEAALEAGRQDDRSDEDEQVVGELDAGEEPGEVRRD